MKRFFRMIAAGSLARWLFFVSFFSFLPILYSFDQSEFEADTRYLSSFSHRLSGTDSFHQAADYVLDRLKEERVETVFEQPFLSAQTDTLQCEVELIDADGKSFRKLPLLTLRPNGVVPPSTYKEGIIGKVVYAGKGGLGGFKDSPLGNVVLLDYNSDGGWIRAFRLGAKAVIFLRDENPDSHHSKHFLAPVNIPRYYYDGDRLDFRNATKVRIRTAEVWKRERGRNIVAYFPGKQPRLRLASEETLIVATALDSFGAVPRKTPGARGAASVAGMIQWASELQQERPNRNILLVFWDNDARGHLGAQAFFSALATQREKADLERRQRSFENETEFAAKLELALQQADPFESEESIRRELRLRLRRIADREVAKYRRERGVATLGSEKLPKDSVERIDLEQRIEIADKKRIQWSELKRALANFNISTQVRAEFNEALQQLKDSNQRRIEELEIEGDGIEGSFRVREILADKEITLCIDIKASDRHPDWGALTGGFSSSVNAYWDQPGLYGGVYYSLQAAVEELSDSDRPIDHFQSISADQTLPDPRIFSARFGYAYGGEVAGTMGIQSILFAPAQDDFSWLGTPGDTFDSLNLDTISEQLQDMFRMTRAMGDSEVLSFRSSVLSDAQYMLPTFSSAYRRSGPVALSKQIGSLTADTPTPGAMIMIMHSWPMNPVKERFEHDETKTPAFDNFFFRRASEEGSYDYGPMDSRKKEGHAFAFAFDERGNVNFSSNEKDMKKVNERLNLFPAKSAFFLPLPRLDSTPTIAFDALSDSRLNNGKSLFKDLDGVFMVHYEDMVDRVKAFSKQSMSSLNLQEIEMETDPETGEITYDRNMSLGFGYDTTYGMPPIMSADKAASDLIHLNDFRLKQMRSKSIFNSAIDELHGQAVDLLNVSQNTDSIKEKESKAALAFHISRSVYHDTKNSIKDLVVAVILLLLLAMPFAFAMERLIFGAAIIYKQVWGFLAFFVLAFSILYWTHPAFAISATPMVIFLGFIIMLLSILVIVIIMRKFEDEFLILQGMGATVHNADVSRLGTMMAAMSMGISTMRRRPMRTALTVSTIILLTFTLLTFSSFGGSLGILRNFQNPLPAYSAVQVKKTTWERLHNSFVDLIQGRWGDEAIVAPRSWVTEETRFKYPNRTGLLLSNADLSQSIPLRGALGLTDQELDARTDIAGLLQAPENSLEGRIWLTTNAAQRLNAQEGDIVLAAGRQLKIGRLLDSKEIVQISDMDGSSILPVDLASYEFKDEDDETSASDDVASFKALSADSIAIVSDEFARSIGGFTRIAHIYTDSSLGASTIADDLTKASDIPIFVTLADGVYRQIFGTVIAPSGIRNLLLPIILGGMVIFGTMLGSVADRAKEIYTFSALGLAPPHVASLFFAEAMVFSIIGGLGGYLLSQILNKGFVWMAREGLMAMPEMNFSSFNAVITLIIVMLVVLASSIYPAIKASKSANPGVMRNWKLPSPQGDLLEMVFPFTVSVYDITGVVSFLKEHYDNCSDVGLGDFITMESSYLKNGENEYGLRACVALAPFDLGVTQIFELTSYPSELPGVDEVKIRIQRLSGQPKDWARLNKNLVNDLRKQFLIWRSLPKETMEEYRQRTLQAAIEEVAV